MSSMKIYFMLIVLTLVWGVNVSLVKVLVEHMQPVTITSIRIFTAGLTVFLILSLSGRIRLPYKKEWKYIIGGSFTAVIFHHYFLSIGLTHTSATNAGLILGMAPLLTVILSMIFFKKKPTMITGLGFILGGIGVSITVLFGSGQLQGIQLGDFEVFLAILSQAFSFILIRKASKTMSPVLLTGYMLFIGSLVLFVMGLLIEPGGLSSLVNTTPFIWVIFLFSAIFATGLGHMVYNYAISQIGAAEASIFLNLNTLFSIVGAALLLGEILKPAHYLGFVLIVSGVILGSGTLETMILQRKNRKIELHPPTGTEANH